jgi:DNA-binding NarL/FixJ family response regulator
MCVHLERAIDLATEQGRPAARCEIQALLAIEVARLGAEQQNEVLLDHAVRHAGEAMALAASLPGHSPWAAQAHAALARVALARGSAEDAAAEGRLALDAIDAAVREDMHLEIVLPAAAGVLAAGSEQERAAVAARLQLMMGLIAPRFDDADSRARWFRSPLGRELTELAGAVPTSAPAEDEDVLVGLAPDQVTLLGLLGQAQTDGEIAEALGISEQAVAERLAALFAAIGAGSRVDAATLALTGRVL